MPLRHHRQTSGATRIAPAPNSQPHAVSSGCVAEARLFVITAASPRQAPAASARTLPFGMSGWISCAACSPNAATTAEPTSTAHSTPCSGESRSLKKAAPEARVAIDTAESVIAARSPNGRNRAAWFCSTLQKPVRAINARYTGQSRKSASQAVPGTQKSSGDIVRPSETPRSDATSRRSYSRATPPTRTSLKA